MNRTTPAEARAVEAKAKTEAQFLREVIEMAQGFGWLVSHQRPAWTEKGWRTAIQGDPGFPDLVLTRPHPQAPRLLLIELKTERGKLTPAQQEWRSALGDAEKRDWEYYLFTPSMMDEIVETLKR